MQEIIDQELPMSKKSISKELALKEFNKMGESFKEEIIEGFPHGEKISLYYQNMWTSAEVHMFQTPLI